MTVYWSTELPAGSGANGSHTRIAIDGASNVHLLYYDATLSGLMHAIGTPGSLYVASRGTAVSGGHQWTPEDLEDASYSDPNYHWSDPDLNALAIDSKGRLHLCLFTMDQLSHAIWDGSKYVLTAVDKKLGSLWDLAMTIGKDDSVHIAYVLPTDSHGKTTLKYATSANEPYSFQPTAIDTRSGWISNVSIANSGDTFTTGVSYINGVWANSSTNPTMNSTFMLVYAENQKTSTVWTTEIADPGPMASGLPPNVIGAWDADRGTNSLILDSSGAPHIAYFSNGLGMRHGTRASKAGSPWVSDSQGNRGEPVDVAGQASPASILLDQSGVLYIAYQAQGAMGTELRLATRAGSGPWLTETVDAGLNSGFAISAALDPNGQPHIAYGFIPFVNGWLELKHTYRLNLTLVPFPHKPKKLGPFLRRPGT